MGEVPETTWSGLAPTFDAGRLIFESPQVPQSGLRKDAEWRRIQHRRATATGVSRGKHNGRWSGRLGQGFGETAPASARLPQKYISEPRQLVRPLQVGPQAPPVAAVETVARQTWHAEGKSRLIRASSLDSHGHLRGHFPDSSSSWVKGRGATGGSGFLKGNSTATQWHPKDENSQRDGSLRDWDGVLPTLPTLQPASREASIGPHEKGQLEEVKVEPPNFIPLSQKLVESCGSLARAFAYFDPQHTGKVTRTRWDSALSTLHIDLLELCNAASKQVFKIIDCIHGHGKGEIQLEEWNFFFKQLLEGTDVEHLLWEDRGDQRAERNPTRRHSHSKPMTTMEGGGRHDDSLAALPRGSVSKVPEERGHPGHAGPTREVSIGTEKAHRTRRPSHPTVERDPIPKPTLSSHWSRGVSAPADTLRPPAAALPAFPDAERLPPTMVVEERTAPAAPERSQESAVASPAGPSDPSSHSDVPPRGDATPGSGGIVVANGDEVTEDGNDDSVPMETIRVSHVEVPPEVAGDEDKDQEHPEEAPPGPHEEGLRWAEENAIFVDELPAFRNEDQATVSFELRRVLKGDASYTDLELSEDDLHAIALHEELHEEIKTLDLSGIQAFAYVLIAKFGSLKKAFRYFDTNRQGRFGQVAWETGLVLLRIDLERLTGFRPVQVFHMMDQEPQGGSVSKKKWNRFFFAIEEGHLASTLKETAQVKGTLKERAATKSEHFKTVHRERRKEVPTKPRRRGSSVSSIAGLATLKDQAKTLQKSGSRRPRKASSRRGSGDLAHKNPAMEQKRIEQEDAFRQKALEELDELMRGDAMTYMNDSFTKWKPSDQGHAQNPEENPRGKGAFDLLPPEDKCEIVEEIADELGLWRLPRAEAETAKANYGRSATMAFLKPGGPTPQGGAVLVCHLRHFAESTNEQLNHLKGTNGSLEFPPMLSEIQRVVVHVLAATKGLTTLSEGIGANRRLVAYDTGTLAKELRRKLSGIEPGKSLVLSEALSAAQRRLLHTMAMEMGLDVKNRGASGYEVYNLKDFRVELQEELKSLETGQVHQFGAALGEQERQVVHETAMHLGLTAHTEGGRTTRHVTVANLKDFVASIRGRMEALLDPDSSETFESLTPMQVVAVEATATELGLHFARRSSASGASVLVSVSEIPPLEERRPSLASNAEQEPSLPQSRAASHSKEKVGTVHSQPGQSERTASHSSGHTKEKVGTVHSQPVASDRTASHSSGHTKEKGVVNIPGGSPATGGSPASPPKPAETESGGKERGVSRGSHEDLGDAECIVISRETSQASLINMVFEAYASGQYRGQRTFLRFSDLKEFAEDMKELMPDVHKTFHHFTGLLEFYYDDTQQLQSDMGDHGAKGLTLRYFQVFVQKVLRRLGPQIVGVLFALIDQRQ